MLRKLALTAIAALAAAAASAKAEDPPAYLLQTAADVATLCGAPQDPSAIHMCQGFLVGTHRVYQAIGAAMNDPFYCLPTDGSVTRDSAARDITIWINSTPEAGSLAPHEVVLEWARRTHPCN